MVPSSPVGFTCILFNVRTLFSAVLWNTRISTLHFVSRIGIKLAQCFTVRAQNHANLTQWYLIYGWSGIARRVGIVMEYNVLVYLIYSEPHTERFYRDAWWMITLVLQWCMYIYPHVKSRIRFWHIRICCIWIIIPLFLYHQSNLSGLTNVKKNICFKCMYTRAECPMCDIFVANLRYRYDS